jgi:hypothetical protein
MPLAAAGSHRVRVVAGDRRIGSPEAPAQGPDLDRLICLSRRWEKSINLVVDRVAAAPWPGVREVHLEDHGRFVRRVTCDHGLDMQWRFLRPRGRHGVSGPARDPYLALNG